MDKELTKIPESAESKVLDKEREKYPVQQVSVTLPITDKEVESAVKEINPDADSLGSRG
ncbi:hypothetical protein [Parabacteroides sp. AM08-6]|uniref:hypothetical protein n=1 Tax=Parabacteroides sp. AM08-6 TaxID=2292053 RepID=UPI0018F67259|nr:hypothetical protein [Parabacteroides sp. AM08-6]